MSNNLPYSALGGVFEYLNDDCGYEQWSQYLIKKLAAEGSFESGLDVGCGNGWFTRAFAKAGYRVTGMDISPQMLTKAVELTKKEGLDVRFFRGDIRRLKLDFKPGFITAVNDCINYLSGDELYGAFCSVYKNLIKGGIFIFDISSAYKLKNVLANNTFAEDRENAAYMWFNTLHSDCVEMDITLFLKQSDGKFIRLDERHTQYIHEKNFVVSELERAGFSVRTEGHLGLDENQRINFICKKY